jgi:hypothetical protein
MIVLLLLGFVFPIVRFLLFGFGARMSDVAGFDLGSEFVQREQLLALDGGITMIVVAAILGITGEYRHRTITWTFLATPARERVILTKFFVYVVISLLYGLVVAALVTGCALLLLSIEGVPLAVPWDVIMGDYARDIVGIAVSIGLAFSLGALLVNQIAAIVIVLAEPLVSALLFGLWPEVGRFLPTNAAAAALDQQTFAFEGPLSRPAGIAVIVGYLVVLNLLAIYLTRRRDIT